jgi:alkaline phosphatase
MCRVGFAIMVVFGFAVVGVGCHGRDHGGDMARPSPDMADNNTPSPASPDMTPVAAAPATRVLFFLGDGMGIATMTAARIYAVGEDGDLTMDTLPETGFVHTYSNDAMVTDSAPSMSAYMTGVKMNNEVIAMSPDTVAPPYGPNGELPACDANNGSPVSTFLEAAKSAGWGTGVITTTRVTHATPAATYAHICHRDREFDIATQLAPGGDGYNKALGDGVDVVFGGGTQQFLPASASGGGRTDGRDLFQQMRAHGYTTVTTRAAFDKIAPAVWQKAIALFTPSHMHYEADRDPTVEPSLAEMTTKAMTVLERRGSYFLMVEGGRIDHALHETNAARALRETVAFDNAIKAAIDQAKKSDPDLAHTLIVVTADHDHTMMINGYSHRTGPTTPDNPGILGLVKNVITGAIDTDADGMPYSILGFGNGENRFAGARSTMTALTDMITGALDYHQEAGFRTTAGNETHGGTDVAIMAIGAHAELIHGFMDNTSVYPILRAAAGF